MIPDCCPICQEKDRWKEIINPFTTGIPITKNVRISLMSIHGFSFHMVTYSCGKCGYEKKYDLRDEW